MTNPRPKAGRPTSLDQEIDIPIPGGGTRRVTVEARIIELMGTGAHVDTAAASLGVDRMTLHTWLKHGARARIAITTGKLGHPDDPDAEKPPPEPHHLRCMTFSIAVDAASADWLMRQEATLETASRPHQRIIEVEKQDAAGNIIEKSRRIEHDGPDLPTLRWRMEKRAPDLYGNRQTIELSGPDGDAIPVDVRVNSLADKIAAVRAKRDQPDPDPEGESHDPDA